MDAQTNAVATLSIRYHKMLSLSVVAVTVTLLFSSASTACANGVWEVPRANNDVVSGRIVLQ